MYTLRLEEGGVVTECALKTLDAEDLLDVNFRGSPVHNKVEMDVCLSFSLNFPLVCEYLVVCM